ncbi:hypothetical protein [Streptomyces lincolnensis]|uniref:hypothetical protein n=1 Tax=Streptomyces lincolnensis TaxID=1915 RepID=UPI0037D25EBC
MDGTTWGDVLVPREGCEARGRASLAGDSALWARITYVPEKYDNDLAARISAHPVAGPSPEFNELEKATAVVDGGCALASHVPVVSLAVQRALVTELPGTDRRTPAELAH